MRENETLTRNCATCEYYETGCEERCPFELEEDDDKRPTLLEGRKYEKAKRARQVNKAQQVVSSANKKKGQRDLHAKPKNAHVKADRALEKAQEYRKKREEKNKAHS